MVGLPSVENREMILRTLLSKEKVQEGLDFKELATMTEGYSGSDVKVSKAIRVLGCLMLNYVLTDAALPLHRTCAQRLLIGLYGS